MKLLSTDVILSKFIIKNYLNHHAKYVKKLGKLESKKWMNKYIVLSKICSWKGLYGNLLIPCVI